MGGFVKKKLPKRWLRQWQRRQANAISWHLRQPWASQPFELTNRPALIVAPHQDDETFGCGGLIALKHERGVPVHVVFLTDGAASPNPSAESVADLVQRRRQEALQALAILGIGEECVHFLDLPDGSLAASAHQEEAQNAVLELLTLHRLQEVYVTHRRDRHPDHEAAYKIVLAAIRGSELNIDLFEYPVWMLWSAAPFFWLIPEMMAGALRLSIESVQGKKQCAIDAYPSQCLTLPKGFLDQFLHPSEIFFCPRRPRL